MGDGGVCGGCGDGGEEEGVDCDWAYSVGASGDGVVRGVDEGVFAGGEGGVCGGEGGDLGCEVIGKIEIGKGNWKDGPSQGSWRGLKQQIPHFVRNDSF